MERKLKTLLAERQALVSEFAAQSLAIHICFVACAVVFYLGLMFSSPVVMASSYAMLFFFAIVELRVRRNYVEMKLEIEREIEKLSGVRIKRKRIVGYLP